MFDITTQFWKACSFFSTFVFKNDTMKIKMTVFWAVAPYSLVEVDQRFRGTYCVISKQVTCFDIHQPCVSHHLYEGCSRYLWNVGHLLWYYTAQYLRRTTNDFNVKDQGWRAYWEMVLMLTPFLSIPKWEHSLSSVNNYLISWLVSFTATLYNKIFPRYQPCQLVKRWKKPRFQGPSLSSSAEYWCIWRPVELGRGYIWRGLILQIH
jgi:hypothetical protein